MPFDVSTLNKTLYLCEEVALARAVSRAVLAPCPKPREVVEARQAILEDARLVCSRSLESCGLDHPEELEMAAQGGRHVRASKGRVAVIPIYGPVDQRYSSELGKAGGTPLEAVMASLEAVENDSAIESVVLHIDSPGGSTYGTSEVSDRIYSMRGKKKMYCSIDSMAASAGYWIASACELVCITPGGDAGSVGVYCLHVDQSKALETEGVKVTAVFAGKHKVDGNSWSPLGEDAQGHLQERVDAIYGRFLSHLSRNRGLSVDHVRKEFGEGRLFNAKQAMAAGMVDRIIPYAELIARLTGAGQSKGEKAETVTPGISTGMLKLRHQHRQRRVA